VRIEKKRMAGRIAKKAESDLETTPEKDFSSE